MTKLSDYTVKRLFVVDNYKKDKYLVSLDTEDIATVNFDAMRAFILGKIEPEALSDIGHDFKFNQLLEQAEMGLK